MNLKNGVRRLVGLFWFDVVWLSAVAGREDWLWATLILVAIQFVITLKSTDFNWRFYVGFFAGGLVLEAIATGSGVVDFTGGFLPVWLILLWAGFVAMLMNTLDWLSKRYWVAALIGIVSGPTTYAIGVRLDAATLGVSEWLMWVMYAVLWGAYMAVFAHFFKPSSQESKHEIS